MKGSHGKTWPGIPPARLNDQLLRANLRKFLKHHQAELLHGHHINLFRRKPIPEPVIGFPKHAITGGQTQELLRQFLCAHGPEACARSSCHNDGFHQSLLLSHSKGKFLIVYAAVSHLSWMTDPKPVRLAFVHIPMEVPLEKRRLSLEHGVGEMAEIDGHLAHLGSNLLNQHNRRYACTD
ncbi:hypothetical protein D3C75_747740 [compost metagenome]